LHSLAVTERRGLFKGWTLLLAVMAFSLSLLGTFLVRSGVLVSVHAFASDPSRGVFILALLAFFIGGALALYAWRAPALAQSGGFRPHSRETFLLLNNMLLVVSAILILFGTLYPLFLDALSLGKISVGPPYFNTVFLIPTLPLVAIVGLGMHTAWQGDSWRRIRKRLWPFAAAALAAAVLLPLIVYHHASLLAPVGIFLAIWLMGVALFDPVSRLLRRRSLADYPRGALGMCVAHFGVAMFVLGITVVSAFGVESDLGLSPGERTVVEGYEFEFVGTRQVEGPNYSATQAEVVVTRDGSEVAVLHPQKRVYRVQQNPMTEAAIHARLSRDIFVALGEPLGGKAWSMRIQYKPMIRLIWLGALVMALGGVLAASDRRYRVRRTEEAVEPAQGAAPAGGRA
jgi:cytochrome c-type biogenesis protein CcmF